MNCPYCGSPDESEVILSFPEVARILRQRQCAACSERWQTKETYVLASIKSANNLPNNAICTVPEKQGGVSLSGICSGSDPDPLGSPEKVITRSDQARALSQVRGAAKEYPDEFERLWAGCKGRRGNKFPAFKAWNKNKPDVELIITRWLRWMETGQFRSGAVPHLASWLNDRGWETEPTQEELRPWNTKGAKAPILPIAVQAERNAAAALEDAREKAVFERELKIPFVDPHSIDWTTGKKKVAP